MEEEEDEEAQALLQALRDEHQPVDATEEILVYKMAQHFFAQKRAEELMNEHLMVPYDGERNTRELSLLMRYHATADRGFNKCLSDLRKLQKERQMEEIGFVSQNLIPSRDRKGADSIETAVPEKIGFVSQKPIPSRDREEADPAAAPEPAKPWAKFFNRAPITSPNAVDSPALAAPGQA